MGDILDNLFGIIPVAIGIIWVLRRFSRQAKKAENKGEKKPVESRRVSASGNPAGGLMEQFRAFEERLNTGNSDTSAPEMPWPGSPALSAESEKPRPDTAPAVSGIPVISTTPGPTLVVRRNVGVSPTGDQPRTVVPGTLERLDRLSPLARGLVWSFILEAPPSLKEPGN